MLWCLECSRENRRIHKEFGRGRKRGEKEAFDFLAGNLFVIIFYVNQLAFALRPDDFDAVEEGAVVGVLVVNGFAGEAVEVVLLALNAVLGVVVVLTLVGGVSAVIFQVPLLGAAGAVEAPGDFSGEEEGVAFAIEIVFLLDRGDMALQIVEVLPVLVAGPDQVVRAFQAALMPVGCLDRPAFGVVL